GRCPRCVRGFGCSPVERLWPCAQCCTEPPDVPARAGRTRPGESDHVPPGDPPGFPLRVSLEANSAHVGNATVTCSCRLFHRLVGSEPTRRAPARQAGGGARAGQPAAPAPRTPP